MVAVMVPCMIHIPVRADYQSVGPPLRCVPMIFGKVIFFICNGPTIHVQAWQMAFLIPVRDPKFALFAERARSGSFLDMLKSALDILSGLCRQRLRSDHRDRLPRHRSDWITERVPYA